MSATDRDIGDFGRVMYGLDDESGTFVINSNTVSTFHSKAFILIYNYLFIVKISGSIVMSL